MPPVRYLGITDVAAWFGVRPQTISQWLKRYHGWPEPDAMISTAKGWLPDREADWRAWHAARPGRGAPGKPKPRRPAGKFLPLKN